MKEHYEQLHTNKLDDLEETENLRKTCTAKIDTRRNRQSE